MVDFLPDVKQSAVVLMSGSRKAAVEKILGGEAPLTRNKWEVEGLTCVRRGLVAGGAKGRGRGEEDDREREAKGREDQNDHVEVSKKGIRLNFQSICRCRAFASRQEQGAEEGGGAAAPGSLRLGGSSPELLC